MARPVLFSKHLPLMSASFLKAPNDPQDILLDGLLWCWNTLNTTDSRTVALKDTNSEWVGSLLCRSWVGGTGMFFLLKFRDGDGSFKKIGGSLILCWWIFRLHFPWYPMWRQRPEVRPEFRESLLDALNVVFSVDGPRTCHGPQLMILVEMFETTRCCAAIWYVAKELT